MDYPHATSKSRALVNPRPHTVRLVLSDGSERISGPWGIVVLPLFASDGSPLEIVLAELVTSQAVVAREAA
jgi:hypothetical protein